MQFPAALERGSLIRRYKRFLADVRLGDGRVITVHVPNTGSMQGCADPDSPVALSHHPGGQRKYPYTLELVQVGACWVGVNTQLPNHITEEALRAGRIGPLRGYGQIRREVAYGDSSRIDLLLEGSRGRCWVEVKNVTLRQGPSRQASFPDAVTTRGTKHLLELQRMVHKGDRAVMFFLVNRGDCTSMSPAEAIDPTYARTLRKAARAGVELLAYRTHIDLEGIRIERKLPVQLDT